MFVLAAVLSGGLAAFLPLQTSSDGESSLQAIEKDMAGRPQEALIIARRAADQLADANDRKRLFTIAARYQESQLKNLSEPQIVDLVKVFETELEDTKAARRVRLAWLSQKAMTQDEVRRIVGQPSRISWQVLYRHQIEQWVYEDPISLRIDFDCVKGLDARLLGVHSVNSKKR
jgi:hypothetical protein